jgi:hypothetical protein
LVIFFNVNFVAFLVGFTLKEKLIFLGFIFYILKGKQLSSLSQVRGPSTAASKAIDNLEVFKSCSGIFFTNNLIKLSQKEINWRLN